MHDNQIAVFNVTLRRAIDPAFISAPRHFLEALDQSLALEAGQPLDPEHAVQLIDLVLVADRAQSFGIFGQYVAVDVLIADPDARITRYLVVDTGHRDAAFPMQDRLGRCPDDLWIDIGPRAIDGVEIEHHDPQGNAVVQRVVKHGHRLRRERKPRVGITDDGADGHDLLSCIGEWLRGIAGDRGAL